MFEKMMKYKKAWDKFCNWLLKQKATLSLEIAILSIMPFFFDEHEIHIQIGVSLEEDWYFSFDSHIDSGENFLSRIEALKAACEKAFEILEDQNV